MMTPWSQAGPRRGARSTSNQEQGILTGPFRTRKSQKLTKEEMELAKEEMELTKEETELTKEETELTKEVTELTEEVMEQKGEWKKKKKSSLRLTWRQMKQEETWMRKQMEQGETMLKK